MCHVNRDSLTHCSQGSVAQLVEQRTSNPWSLSVSVIIIDGAQVQYPFFATFQKIGYFLDSN